MLRNVELADIGLFWATCELILATLPSTRSNFHAKIIYPLTLSFHDLRININLSLLNFNFSTLLKNLVLYLKIVKINM